MDFYCKKVCGDPDFDIDEWNEALDYCQKAGLSKEESDKILHPELFPCETQCEDCMNTVLDTQIKNNQRRNRHERNTRNITQNGL
jgi:hypothetical protein